MPLCMAIFDHLIYRLALGRFLVYWGTDGICSLVFRICSSSLTYALVSHFGGALVSSFCVWRTSVLWFRAFFHTSCVCAVCVMFHYQEFGLGRGCWLLVHSPMENLVFGSSQSIAELFLLFFLDQEFKNEICWLVPFCGIWVIGSSGGGHSCGCVPIPLNTLQLVLRPFPLCS